MKYTIPAIPTMYSGTRFRSRLEARWAVFFDSVQWPWEYEPFDLDGYIPDFVLPFMDGNLLVEVKPYMSMGELESEELRVVLSGWDGEFMVVGSRIHDSHGDPLLGMLYEPINDNGRREWCPGGAEIFACINCGATSIKSSEHSFRCRVSGCYDGNGHVGQIEKSHVADLWASAGNRVQWRAA